MLSSKCALGFVEEVIVSARVAQHMVHKGDLIYVIHGLWHVRGGSALRSICSMQLVDIGLHGVCLEVRRLLLR